MNFKKYLKMGYALLMQRLYAKSTYKLFLIKTFDEMDEATRKLKLLTHSFSSEIRPIVITAPLSNSMLVVSPHQDDEAIGCGGAILAQKKSGQDVAIIFVSDGGDEFNELGYASRAELINKREDEANKVAAFIGIDAPQFLRCPNIKDNQLDISNKLVAEIERTNADSIFTPFFIDGHVEHQLVTIALADALKKIKRPITVYCYEVWSLCIPNVILNIDEFIEAKKQMIALYDSQCAVTDYVNSSVGLNMYHARKIGKTCQYAECYFETPKEHFIKIVDSMRSSELTGK